MSALNSGVGGGGDAVVTVGLGCSHQPERGTTDQRRDDDLRTLVEKSPHADLLREMIGFGAHRLMEFAVQGLAGAGYGGEEPGALRQRNGFATAIGRCVPEPSNCASQAA
jgi:hypothetical protein